MQQCFSEVLRLPGKVQALTGSAYVEAVLQVGAQVGVFVFGLPRAAE